MKTILIDDEAMALEVLEHMLSPYEEINIIGKYTKYIEALESIERIKPDIIFLDIEMGEVNGLEVADIFMEKLERVEIVFVTAYSQYAVDAFEINAIDYLLKPIQEKRLFKAIERLKERKSEKDKHHENIKGQKGLEVYSFGGFQVLDNEGDPLAWRTQKSKELFAYLWVRKDRAVSRDLIIESIFPNREADRATTLLHTTVYQLRKVLKELGYSNSITYSDESYQLNIGTGSDLERLKNIMELERYNEDDIGEVLQTYRGDFLEEGYHWAMELQQIYRNLVFKILESFVRDEIGDERFSLLLKVSLDKLYVMDPLNENIVEMMIHYYGKQNKRFSLEIFFNDYRETLWHEMELQPMKIIMNIYKGYMELI